MVIITPEGQLISKQVRGNGAGTPCTLPPQSNTAPPACQRRWQLWISSGRSRARVGQWFMGYSFDGRRMAWPCSGLVGLSVMRGSRSVVDICCRAVAGTLIDRSSLDITWAGMPLAGTHRQGPAVSQPHSQCKAHALSPLSLSTVVGITCLSMLGQSCTLSHEVSYTTQVGYTLALLAVCIHTDLLVYWI